MRQTGSIISCSKEKVNNFFIPLHLTLFFPEAHLGFLQTCKIETSSTIVTEKNPLLQRTHF